MIAHLALRALGWERVQAAPAPPIRLSDPAGDAVTRELVDAGLWEGATHLSLVRDGRKLTLRLFTPEAEQSQRQAGKERAVLAKALAVGALRTEGYIVKVSDVLFYEKGTKGWVVIVTAAEGR